MAGEKKFVMGDLCRILVSYFSCSFGVSVGLVSYLSCSFGVSVSSIYTKSPVYR